MHVESYYDRQILLLTWFPSVVQTVQTFNFPFNVPSGEESDTPLILALLILTSPIYLATSLQVHHYPVNRNEAQGFVSENPARSNRQKVITAKLENGNSQASQTKMHQNKTPNVICA